MCHQPQLMPYPLRPVALDTQLASKTNSEQLKRTGHPDPRQRLKNHERLPSHDMDKRRFVVSLRS
jgi:hypothetical protein